MTNREFFNAIITGTVVLNAGKESETSYPAYADGVLIDELVEFAKTSIEKINKKNEAAKGREKKSAKPNPENEALKNTIFDGMEPGTTYTAKVIADTFDINTQKASAMLRQMVAAGTIEEVETKKNAAKEYRRPID